MVRKLQDFASQSGRIAIVTGANIGLGYETAMVLAEKGCTVVMACRNLEKAQAAMQELLQQAPDASVTCMPLDLSSLASVRSFAQAFSRSHSQLDLLINNAGIMMPPYALSEDGFESQWAANYLGHFALTGLLLPLLVKTPHSRVVSLSSLAHNWGQIRLEDPNFTKGYDKREAYGQSKLACLMFAYELQRRLSQAGHGTISVAAHPGVSATNLFQHLPKVVQVFSPLMSFIFQSAKGGAQPPLYAALGADVVGGDYFGPGSMGQMRGAPVKVGSTRASRDLAVAKALWSLSERQSGVRYLG
ncbi:MAG: short-chain dehydrogenase [Burkholderiales bacterium PBB4]|nr:MAG: short-chain dehydrogenase [Burkholderiales bacterium PBB4]